MPCCCVQGECKLCVQGRGCYLLLACIPALQLALSGTPAHGCLLNTHKDAEETDACLQVFGRLEDAWQSGKMHHQFLALPYSAIKELLTRDDLVVVRIACISSALLSCSTLWQCII